MIKRLLFLMLIPVYLFAIELHSVYYVNNKDITLRDILPEATENLVLYTIRDHKHSKKVKAKNLIALLKQHSSEQITSSSRYIRFIEKSPIDIEPIKNRLKERYKEHYPNMKINSIVVMPRGFIKSLPENYKVSINKKEHLSSQGIVSIKTPENRKHFFDYTVDATLYVYIAKRDIRRYERISALNTIKKRIDFNQFRALPINVDNLNVTQAKRKIKTGKALTQRDIQTLHLVKKGANVNVNLKNKNINISFLAKALQNGRLNDIITVQKRDKTRLRVRIISKNQVELK